MKEYSYKVVGVTFEGRQDKIRRLFDEVLEDPYADTEFEAELRPYTYEGRPALAVDVAGVNIGNIASADVEAVSEISRRAGACWVEFALNGVGLEYVRHARETLRDRRDADPFDVDEAEDLLEEIRDAEEKIYSAMIHLVVYDQQPDPAPGPIQYEQTRRQDGPHPDARPFSPDPPKAARPGKGFRIARTVFAVLAVLDLIGVIAMQDASAIYTIFVWAVPAVLFHFLAKRKEKGK